MSNGSDSDSDLPDLIQEDELKNGSESIAKDHVKRPIGHCLDWSKTSGNNNAYPTSDVMSKVSPKPRQRESRRSCSNVDLDIKVLPEVMQNSDAGDRFMEKGQLQGAVRCYERSVTILRDHLQEVQSAGLEARQFAVSLLSKLAKLYLREDQSQDQPQAAKALTCYENMLLLSPDCLEAAFRRAEMLEELGRYVEAEAAFKNASELEGKQSILQAPSQSQERLPREGQRDWTRDFLSPSDLLKKVQELRERGGAEFKHGRTQKAVNVYTQAVSLLQEHHRLWKGVARKSGDVAEQLNLIGSSILANIAYCYLHGEPPNIMPNAKSALFFSDKAIELNPSNAKALFRRGRALSGLGRHSEAEVAMCRASELEPKDQTIHKEISKLQQLTQLVRSARELTRTGQYEMAIAAFTRASFLEPMDDGIKTEIEDLHKLTSDEDNSLVSSAVDHQLPLATPSQRIAERMKAHRRQQPPKILDKQGLEDLLEVVELLRRDGASHFKAGNMRLSSECYEQAMERLRAQEHQYRRVLEESDLSKRLRVMASATLTNLALCYLTGKPPDIEADNEKALARCREALELDPRNVKALFRQGKALAALGRHIEAEVCLARAADLEPKDEAIRRTLDNSIALARETERLLTVHQFRASWPEHPSPTPLGVLGSANIAAFAENLALEFLDNGLSGYTMRLLYIIREEVENYFGAGSGKLLGRIVPFVQRMSKGEFYQTEKPDRTVTTYLDGLDPERPWHESLDMPWCEKLAERSSAILSEVQEIEKQAREQGSSIWFPPDPSSGISCGAIVNLVRQGMWVAGEYFQHTRAILASLHDMRPYDVLLLRIPPGSHKTLHSSDSNCVLTMHLGLDMDEDSCNSLNISGSSKEWHVGTTLLFDHTYRNSACISSHRDCIILSCRFYHPRICEVERYALLLLSLLVDAVREVPLFQLASQYDSLVSTGTASGR